ncbi:MAG: Do family serine endopeptidase [Bryobacteraceae bacterium]
MLLLEKLRQQKLLSTTLIVITLGIGIVLGTFVNGGVHAAKSQFIAPDASPLVIPNPVQLGNEFTKLAKTLEPSVVYITADYTARATSMNPHGKLRSPGEEDNSDEGLDLFKRFFRNGPGAEAPPRAYRQEQSGTGFVVDKNGYIITNHHVVSRVDRIKVKLHGDPSDYRARVIGYDGETDLAVIKIDTKTPLIPVNVGNSDSVQVGDWAVAIGSPFGLEASVTAGIVSALGRDIGTLQLQRFIQTDAAINPGNSGGPLLNIRGEVIGVNTMIATQSGGYQGIGFALPINMVAKVYNDIIKTGKVTRGSIGVKWNKANKPELLRALGAKQGVMVETVTKGGPAEKAGLKDEDIIVAMNGQPVKDGEELVVRLSEIPIGTVINLSVDRDGKRMDFKVAVEDRSVVFKQDLAQRQPVEEPGKIEGAQAKFGMKIKALTEAERETLDLKDKRGVQVVSVDEGSFAEDIGIQEKDIIVSINRQPVSSVEEVKKIQSSLKPGDPVAFRMMRANPLGARGERGAGWTAFFVSGTLSPE